MKPYALSGMGDLTSDHAAFPPCSGGMGRERVESFFEERLSFAACIFAPFNYLQGPLYPREGHCASGMGMERREEFVAGRTAARMAMKRLGVPPSPICVGDRGEPLWPREIRGSISHSKGFCFCIVTPHDSCLSIGVDMEHINRVRSMVAKRVMTASEHRAWLGGHLSPALVFSAKEAYFKFQYPLTGLFAGFQDAEVKVEDGSFMIRPLREGLPSAEGTFLFYQGMVFTVAFRRLAMPC